MFKTVLGITAGLLLATAASAQTKVGAWELHVMSEEAPVEGRFASTSAAADDADNSMAQLVIRRKKPDSAIEFLIIDTHDPAQDNCDYKNWKIRIDSAEVSVLGHSFEPEKTVLKAKLGAPRDELWVLFQSGLKLVVMVDQRCDSYAGETRPVSYSSSLRGSRAAYRFVTQSQ